MSPGDAPAAQRCRFPRAGRTRCLLLRSRPASWPSAGGRHPPGRYACRHLGPPGTSRPVERSAPDRSDGRDQRGTAHPNRYRCRRCRARRPTDGMGAGATDLATSTTGLRHRVETFFPLSFLALLHAEFVVSDPHVPHVKVASLPPVVREPYVRRVSEDDPPVGGPPVHDRGALGATRVGSDHEVRAPLSILVVDLGSRHRLTRPSAVEARVVWRLRPPLPDCFPTTASEPIEGTTVDSSPVDHLTRKSDPVTPVTTPSRGASPTFLEEICTRSPTTAMYRMVPRRSVSGQRFSIPFARRRS